MSVREVREAGAGSEDPTHLGDLRLVPLAIAAWAGAWIGTWNTGTAVGCGIGAAAALGIASTVRRSGWLVATSLVLVVASILGWLAAHRLAEGPLHGPPSGIYAGPSVAHWNRARPWCD